MASRRGLEAKHEQDQQSIIRDTRPLGLRIKEYFTAPKKVAHLFIVVAICILLVPGLADLGLVLSIGVFLYTFFQKTKLPFRLPQRSQLLDYNDLKPGGKNKPNEARGIYFFGNEEKTNNELWFNNEDMRTHVLIFGSTGSGKTETLISLAYNALVQGSGFIYVDGKGDNSLFAKIFSMCRYMGRTDDLLLINFMTGAKDIVGPQKNKLSNTLNPFAIGSSSMLAQLVVSLMDSSSATPDGDMWKGRAIGFVEAIMMVLVAMRDAGHILLDANTVRNYFLLDRIEAIVMDKLFVRDGAEAVNIEELPPTILEPIRNYLFNLPGYNPDKKGKQVSQVLEQHGFITMQLTRVFTSLADTYGHIMRTKLADVDFRDVVLNRRILTVLLPALEKSPDELSNLGKIIIASLKAMMAAGLGDAVEGEYADLVESKPTHSVTPFLCILDEYGYYAVEGFAVVPAQARSLGFSVVFSGQDLPAFQKASKEEAASIGANTNIKICMKLEDPMETWDFFQKTAGETYVSHIESFTVGSNSVTQAYQDSRGARLEKRQRIDLLDLKEQGLGEMHILFKSKIVRAKSFFANPVPAKRLRLNHMLKVDVPSDEDVHRLKQGYDQFQELLTKEEPFFSVEQHSAEEVVSIAGLINKQPAASALEKVVAAMRELTSQTEVLPTIIDEIPDLPNDQLNIFVPLRTSPHLEGLIITRDIETFANPLLDKSRTREPIEYIQRLCGKTGQQAQNIALELIGDMQRGTQYPPAISVSDATAKTLALAVDKLIEAVSLKKKEAAEKVS
ncbi:MAG: phosphoesterase [Gammaproteobacteria bacterium RIFCSPHIGHO2_12_FULL_41_15]|nr:MAG: phosphoesterase [Gammaproteobacteria bacterium RIFCSPHIGHO2_12_FULL_41_15]